MGTKEEGELVYRKTLWRGRIRWGEGRGGGGGRAEVVRDGMVGGGGGGGGEIQWSSLYPRPLECL